jgi:hypothetical protein
MLIKLCIYAESNDLGVKFKKKAKDYAVLIKKADEYMGYMAWAEIYLSQNEKKEVGIQVLQDLIKDNPNRP